MKYVGKNTSQISFPLGGIGAGSIGLAGNGSLVDWEIFNRPNKESILGNTHFAIKVEDENKVLDARIINSDKLPPYQGITNIHFGGIGFGPAIGTMVGFPHFKDSEFIGEYPIAKINFLDDSFLGKVSLNAFNPLIPMNDKDSSIPCAMFEMEVTNTADKTLTYTVASMLANPAYKSCNHKYSKNGAINTILMKPNGISKNKTIEKGDISISAIGNDVSYQEFAFRGGWFDLLNVYWNDFNKVGTFKNRVFEYEEGFEKNYGSQDHSILAVHETIEPGETKTIKFAITWNYPIFDKYWDQSEVCGPECDCNNGSWKNYYSTIFEDSKDTAKYVLNNWDRLYSETKLYKDTLFSSTMPDYVLDAVSANISILRSPTTIRLENGAIYGFEGCHCDGGCCDGSCQHVWNYAYALPFLFPNLERSFRDLEYDYAFLDGKTGFRLQLPLGSGVTDFRACMDGQMGTIIKCYREWKISGDDNWLKDKWERIKASLEYAWADNNPDKWDADKDGISEGRQHHTLDMELYGPSSWLQGFYLAALKACAEISGYFGETDKQKEYMSLYESGREFLNKELFNGKYYFHKVDLNNEDFAKPFVTDAKVTDLYGNDSSEESIKKSYWDAEHGEIKYQVGEGSSIDQALAQWHANIIGLGEIFDKDKMAITVKSLFENNYKSTMRGFFNPCRIYALNDDAGTVICTYPEGTRKPVIPIPYAEECMNGFEYSAGVLMIQEGLIDEGLTVCKAVRDKYNGENRNPWNEFECGSNYARSMSSYSILLALSGFEFDMVKKYIGFNPIINENDFTSFWSIQNAWGSVKIGKENIFTCLYGEITLNTLKIKDKIVTFENGKTLKVGESIVL